MAEQGSDQSMTLQYREAPRDPGIAERNKALLLDALDAVAAGDFAPFWAMFHPDVVFHEAPCLPYGGMHKGLEATKKAYQHMADTYSGMHSVFEDVLVGGDLAILYQTITFRVKANGNTGTLPVAELFRFRDGKVVEWRALYFDSNMVAKAITGGAAR